MQRSTINITKKIRHANMDFPNEFVVKREPEDTGIDVNVEIEVLDKDWCMDDENSGNPDQLADGEIVIENDERLNNILSHSLFQHNLTHLLVPSDVPAEENDIKSDVMIKCEIVECDPEIVDQMPDTDGKMDYLVEDNNNHVPITKRDHQCHICLKVFKYKRWHEHMREVHSTVTITCELCNKDYKSKKSLRKHSCSARINKKSMSIRKIPRKQKVTGDFKCSQCNDVFNTKDCMQKHVKNVHSRAVNCEICNSRLGSEAYLAAHMRRVHYDDGKVHSCDICGKIFKSPRYVRVHMKNSHYKKNKS